MPERPEAAADLFRPPRHAASGARRSTRGLSARTYFDRVTEPVLIHHGTADDTCPIAWSRTTQRLLRARGGRLAAARSTTGEQHAFGPQWPPSMERTVRFLRRELRADR